MKNNQNLVDLCGIVTDKPVVDHVVYGQSMYQFHLKVTRLSGAEDIVVVQCAENKLPVSVEEIEGHRVHLEGRLRSYNKHVDKKSRLLLYVLVNEMVLCEGQAKDDNNLEISGFLCKKPQLRKISSGKSICDIMLALPKSSKNNKDYIPAICWGVVAQEVAERHEGDFISLKGRLQSRDYTKSEDNGTTTEHTTYEVSVYTCTVIPKEEYDKMQDTEEQ